MLPSSEPKASSAQPSSDQPALSPAEPSDTEIFCPECGYDLQRLSSNKCPECGTEIDRTGLAISRIPWVHRRRVGRFRAYWRTVLLVTLNPKRLAAESSGPVSYEHARLFRIITALIAGLVLGLFMLAIQLWVDADLYRVADITWTPGWPGLAPPSLLQGLAFQWEAGAMLLPVIPICVLIAVILIGGVGSYWFHAKHLPLVRQNRAVALAAYAAGPLAWFPFPAALLAGFGLMVANEMDRKAFPFLVVLNVSGCIATVLILISFWRANLALLRRTTQASAARLILAAILMPLTWAMCGLFVLLLVPWVVGFVRILIGSLR